MSLKTGIPKLDELLNGGVVENNSILFYSTPGVESLPFAYQFLYNRLKAGDNVLYLVNNKKPDTVRMMMKSYDWDVSEFEKNKQFAFFDAYSGLFGLKSNERFSVGDVKSVEKIKDELTKALKELKNKNTILIFDSLSYLLDLCGNPSDVLDYLKKCMPGLQKFNTTPIFLFTAWAYDAVILSQIREFFDCVIDLKAIERKVILRNYFSVYKAGGSRKLEKLDVPFKIIKPGGVKIYIPKVLVTGPYHAGKTSFIHSASTTAVSVNRLGTTVALDYGHVDFRGFAVDLWGTPGQERFDPILELLGGESLGVIVVVDSTDPKGFARAKEMLELTKTSGLPSVIAANKSNLKGALNPEEIKKKMKLSDEIPIISVVAEDLKKVKPEQPCKLKQEDIENVLSKLFEAVV